MKDRPKILCIEDDRATMELLVEVLEDEGYLVIVARDGAEGIARFDERPDLIICDLEMPRGDGFSVIEALRNSASATSEVPFLFITAYGDRNRHIRARRLGCDDFIAKPLDFELLVEMVRHRLRAKGAQRDEKVALTVREAEAMNWVAQGKSSTDTAVLMGLSERTVNFHVNNVVQKLGVATRLQAAVRCAMLGLIKVEFRK
jgi:DNA-binding NarL/FixJ family response regulator